MPAGKEKVDFSLFWKVWDTLESSYIDKSKISYKDMVYGAIQGMVSSLGDPYTVFLPPEQNKVVQEDLQGNFEGVGIQIGFKGKQLAVMATLPKTPAEEAGIKAGDFIIGIKDEKKGIDMGTSGISSAEAVQFIRGEAGSKVTLTLLRDEDPNPIVKEITRKDISVPSVILTFVGEREDIAHIQLLKFAGETNGEWEKVVSSILKENPKGIILDLRSNPGGLLDKTVDISGWFLEKGQIVLKEQNKNLDESIYKADGPESFVNMPIVILINEGTASASEILTGALKDNRGITTIGETSFGKGLVQRVVSLDDGSSLKVTTAKWYTPNGTLIQDTGIKPDIEVELSEEDYNNDRDPQLDRALQEITK